MTPAETHVTPLAAPPRSRDRLRSNRRTVSATRSRGPAFLLAVVATLAGMTATSAADANPTGPRFGEAKLDAWRRMPVLHGGRIMPVDTFAGQAASIVAGSRGSKVRVTVAEMFDLARVPEIAGADLTFDLDGTKATFTPATLAVAWASEPDVWRSRPAILVPEGLRKSLGADASGRASYDAIRANADVMADVQAAQAVGETPTNPKSRPVSKDGPARTLGQRLDAFAAIASDDPAQQAFVRKAFALFPPTDDAGRPLVHAIPNQEAVLSWIIEPDAWEAVPFLPAAHQDLRKLLGLPVDGVGGEHPTTVSPMTVTRSMSLRKHIEGYRMRQQQAAVNQTKFKATPLDEQVQSLLEAHRLFRSLSVEGATLLSGTDLIELPGGRTHLLRLIGRVMDLAEEPGRQGRSLSAWVGALAQLPGVQDLQDTSARFERSLLRIRQLGGQLVETQRAIEKGIDPYEARDEYGVEPAAAAQAVSEFADAATAFARLAAEQRQNAYAGTKLPPEMSKQFGPLFRELATKGDEIARLGREMKVAVHDNDDSLDVVPALAVDALYRHRDVTNESSPWLALSVILHGDLESRYPPLAVEKVRQQWATLVSVWTNRSDDRRAARLDEAMTRFAEAVESLGTQVNVIRDKVVAQELPDTERDDQLLAYTRYPTDRGRLNAEVRYNALSPFLYSLILSSLATMAFLLSFGVIRRPMVYVGAAMLVVTLIWTAYAFSLRVYITGWAPVTNMYETVVYVPFVIVLLGLWFLALPLVWPGVAAAWRMTALPFTPEAKPPSEAQTRMMPSAGWTVVTWLMLPVRLALAGLTFYLLCVAPLADGNRAIIELALPSTATANDWTVYVTSLLMGVGLIYLVPRIVPATVLSVATVPWAFASLNDKSQRFEQIVARQPVGLAAAIGAILFFALAWFVPLYDGGEKVLDPNFKPLQPVLRSNYWLTVHVMTIVASYGAGLLAWVLGMIAVGHYLIGPYRKPQVPAHLPKGFGPADGSAIHRVPLQPPAAVHDLAQYAYRAVQVAVVLLVAGTILGGVWADVSWGRFWGWDPKEVWALITLLIYLTILHGRFTGWFNNFGMIFGTVLGMTMIAMSWYGVNFALPTLKGGEVGLHSYGTGSGGLREMAIFIGLNWAVLAAATVRYLLTTGSVVAPDQSDAADAAIESVTSGGGYGRPVPKTPNL